MIRFHFSSAASSVEILDLRNAGSDLGALGINQNFRKKTEFCLKSALFSLNAIEKGKILFFLFTRSGAKATPTEKAELASRTAVAAHRLTAKP